MAARVYSRSSSMSTTYKRRNANTTVRWRSYCPWLI